MSTQAAPRPIDLLHLGREKVLCCWQVGDVIIDPGPSVCADTLEEALGGERPKAILLTHIHLDHAGGTGLLAERWPGVEVWVHERGARHMIDPSRLVNSAGMLYRDEMQRLWGDILPVPEESVKVLSGGETIPWSGGFDVLYTPGHAQHHVSFRHVPTGMAFVGDVAGVRIPPAGATVAPTPPPDINLELWHESLDAIAAWKPTRLGLTHWGQVDDVDAQIAAVRSCLDDHAALARDLEPGPFADAVRERLAREVGDAVAEAYFQASPPDQLHAGLARYWAKRAEAEESAQ
ncbi:MAG: MBL fold metallo-hydrolase [Actinomycetes bacterium]